MAEGDEPGGAAHDDDFLDDRLICEYSRSGMDATSRTDISFRLSEEIGVWDEELVITSSPLKSVRARRCWQVGL